MASLAPAPAPALAQLFSRGSAPLGRSLEAKSADASPMSVMDLTVRHLGKGSAMECTTPLGVTMTFDDPDKGRHGASPVEHLLASIGACALVDVGNILVKKRLTFRNLRVRCTGTRRDEPPPRVFVDVKLLFEVDGEVPERVFREVVGRSVDMYCSVAGTLVGGTPVAYEAAVHPAAK